MNIYEHCLLSINKFGGKVSDYQEIHSFLDSSKYFYPHFNHRVLLHNTHGAMLCVKKFGEFTSNGTLVRDIAFEHCKEDLSGFVPTLLDWYNASNVKNEITFQEFKTNLYDTDFGYHIGLESKEDKNVQTFLKKLSFSEKWCLKTNQKDLEWLKSDERLKLESSLNGNC